MAASSFLGYVCSWATKQPPSSAELPHSSVVAKRSSAFRVPDTARDLTPIDSMTMIPTDLYDRLLQEGVRTKLRGQHNFHRGADGKPRLVRQCASPKRGRLVAGSKSVRSIQNIGRAERAVDVVTRQAQLGRVRAGSGRGSEVVSASTAERCGMTQPRNCSWNRSVAVRR